MWLPFHFFTQRVTGMTGHEASVVHAVKAWVDQHDIGHAWPLIQQALDDDRLLLIVDGLDEWSGVDAGEYAAAALETFATARSIALVVSSRPYGLQRLTLGPGWSYATIASLSPVQQRSLARAYLEHGLDESARTQEAIDAALTAFTAGGLSDDLGCGEPTTALQLKRAGTEAAHKSPNLLLELIGSKRQLAATLNELRGNARHESVYFKAPWGGTAHQLLGTLSRSGCFRGALAEQTTQPYLIEAMDKVLRRLGGTTRVGQMSEEGTPSSTIQLQYTRCQWPC